MPNAETISLYRKNLICIQYPAIYIIISNIKLTMVWLHSSSFLCAVCFANAIWSFLFFKWDQRKAKIKHNVITANILQWQKNNSLNKRNNNGLSSTHKWFCRKRLNFVRDNCERRWNCRIINNKWNNKNGKCSNRKRIYHINTIHVPFLIWPCDDFLCLWAFSSHFFTFFFFFFHTQWQSQSL